MIQQSDHHPVGPRANRRGIARMGAQGLTIAVDVLRDDRAEGRRHREQDRRVRLLHADDGDLRRGGVHPLHRLEHRLEGVIRLDRHDREGDIVTGDRLAVVERGAGHQLEQQRLAVILEGPRLGEIALRVPALVEAQRAGEDLRRRDAGDGAGLHGRIQVPGHAGETDHQRAGAAGGLRGACAADQGGQGQGRQGLAVEASSWGAGHRRLLRGLGLREAALMVF